MRRFNNFFNQSFFLVAYKLLHDVLFALLIMLSFTLLAEELIPGIISEHIGISKIVVMIALNIFLINLTYPKIEKFEQKNSAQKSSKLGNKKTIIFISLFGILLLINSFLKIGFLLNTLLVIQVIIIAYLLYVITFKK